MAELGDGIPDAPDDLMSPEGNQPCADEPGRLARPDDPEEKSSAWKERTGFVLGAVLILGLAILVVATVTGFSGGEDASRDTEASIGAAAVQEAENHQDTVANQRCFTGMIIYVDLSIQSRFINNQIPFSSGRVLESFIEQFCSGASFNVTEDIQDALAGTGVTAPTVPE